MPGRSRGSRLSSLSNSFIGGEEFFSYLNISDSLKRTGGDQWKKWRSDTSKKILNLQNSDGTWSGHHCITGHVAVTSAAILNLIANREQNRENQP